MTAGLELARRALGGTAAVWVVGGAVRDALRGGGQAADIDLVVDGDVRAAAQAIARVGGAAAFPLSDEFGAWRVVARDRSWRADLNPQRGASLAADLALRDFTSTPSPRPLAGGELVDPLGGAADLAAGRLRLAAAGALAADPLRTLRLVRLAVELDLEPDAAARSAARAAAPGLAGVAAERVFGELSGSWPARGRPTACAWGRVGPTAVVLPELDAMGGIEQNRYHHRDVAGHTFEVLEAAIELERDPGRRLGGEHAPAIRALLAAPLADEMTRGQALRLGALLHDAAKPVTAAGRPRRAGAVARPRRGRGGDGAGVLGRLRTSERLRPTSPPRAPSPAAGLPRPRGAGEPARDLSLSRRVRRRRGRCDAAAGRRPAGYPGGAQRGRASLATSRSPGR